MPYSENQADILARMQGNVPSDVDSSEGTFIYDAISPVSNEIAQLEINQDEILMQAFASTAEENGYSTALENRCAEFGIIRKAGAKATVTLQFTGSDGTYTGISVQTDAGLQYVVPSLTVSGGTGAATGTATTIGAAYNVVVGTITEFPVSVAGLTAVNNTTAAAGGTDDESDAALLARLLVKVQTPSTSGNKNDYKLWALSVDGIGGAKVFPLWNGNGTVKVCLIDSNKQPANSTLVTAVQTYTESVRPIGATVTYEAATGFAINVSATLALVSGYTISGVTPAVEAAITAYLKGIAFSDNLSSSPEQDYVSYARISDAILNTSGVMDVSNLQINSGVANVTVPVEDVAVLGTVTLS